MGSIKIGSFNTKNNSINRHGGIRPNGVSNSDILANQIKKYGFDLFGTQELTINYVNSLVLYLENYKFYGSYRYGNLFLKYPFNENNNIITNKKVLFQDTVRLPWIANNFSDLKTSIVKFSIMPRIATIVIIEDEEYGKICMINTHLDYEIPSIQVRQLKSLKDIILKYNKDYPIVLTGDFNMEIGNANFDSFIFDMKNIDIKHVDIPEKTWFDKDGTGKTLDHIFIPEDWKIEKTGVIDSNGTSDHKVIYVEAIPKVKKK